MAEDSQNEKELSKEILKGFISGDRPQIRLFFELYGGVIKKAVGSVEIKDRSMTHHDLFMAAVENLLKDNMKALRSFKGKCRLSTYIYVICHRCAIALVKGSIVYDRPPFSEVVQAPEALSDELGEEELQVIDKALLLCSQREQLFIRMLFYDECTTKEIMVLFGWNSENTVYSQKNKIIAKLKCYTKRLL